MFQSMSEIETYVDGLNHGQLIAELSKRGQKVAASMKASHLKALLVDVLGKEIETDVSGLEVLVSENIPDENQDGQYNDDTHEDDESGAAEEKGFTPRRLTKEDQYTNRGYRRIMNLFASLELLGKLDEQIEFIKRAHEFWSSLEAKRRKKKNQQAKVLTVDELKAFLRDNPQLLETIKEEFLE